MPIGTTRRPLEHSTLVPPVTEAKVYDVMRTGVLSCLAETPARELARMMDAYRVHAIVVSGLGPTAEAEWGIVSDMDLLAAVEDSPDATAGELARTEFLTVAANESVVRGAQLMREHETAHLVVVEPTAGRPVGVVSTLDVAAAVAWGEAS